MIIEVGGIFTTAGKQYKDLEDNNKKVIFFFNPIIGKIKNNKYFHNNNGVSMKKILCFFTLLLFFNVYHIDSNSSKRLIYDKENIYEAYYNIHLINSDTLILRKALDSLDIEVLSYVIDGKKYYARNIDILEKEFLSDKTLEKRIYYESKGIKVDSINIICNLYELIKLENMVDIY